MTMMSAPDAELHHNRFLIAAVAEIFHVPARNTQPAGNRHRVILALVVGQNDFIDASGGISR
jgi:hypothetical protein